MRILATKMIVISLLVCMSGMVSITAGWAFPITVPLERLAGLQPCVDTLNDAISLYGGYDIALSGHATGFVGGPRATTAYRWTPGSTYGSPGLVVETPSGSSQIISVMVDAYPGLGTSLGLTPLTSDLDAVRLYGLPDYVFKYNFTTHLIGLEMFYLREGLVLLLLHVPDKPNWQITKIILSSPTYLQNAVALNTRTAINSGGRVEDFTNMYRVWAEHAVQPDPAPAHREDY